MPPRPDPRPGGGRGDGADEDFRRGDRPAGGAVMLRDPVPGVAGRVEFPRHRDGVVDGLPRAGVAAYRPLVEHGQHGQSSSSAGSGGLLGWCTGQPFQGWPRPAPYRCSVVFCITCSGTVLKPYQNDGHVACQVSCPALRPAVRSAQSQAAQKTGSGVGRVIRVSFRGGCVVWWEHCRAGFSRVPRTSLPAAMKISTCRYQAIFFWWPHRRLRQDVRKVW